MQPGHGSTDHPAERRGGLSRRLGLGVSLAGLSLIAGAAPASAVVTVGQTAPTTPTPTCASPVDRLQQTVTAGTSFASPTNGKITSWSTNAGTAAGAQMKLKVWRLVSGVTYSVAAQDTPRAITPSTLNTFPLNPGLDVRKGDLIGLNSFAGTPNCSFVVTGDSYRRFPAAPGTGDLATGQSGEFTFTGDVGDRRLNIAAQVEPTNTLTFGKAKFNKKKGIALLTVSVPNDGQLTFAGKKVKVSRGANAARAINAAGNITLRIAAKGKKRKKLLSTGKVKVKPIFSFTPTGGTTKTQSTKLKLRKTT